MADRFDKLDADVRRKLRQQDQPEWTSPMLATLTDEHFSDPDWIFERKFDGERCLVFRKGDEMRMVSRNREPLNRTYPELTDALDAQDAREFIIDGEIVAFDGDVTSFSRLQQRMKIRDEEEARSSNVAVHLYVFDLIHLDGRDCTQVPLRDRKSLLRRTIEFDNRIRFTNHRNEQGEALLQDACRKGWEGLIAKKADSVYAHSRSRNWLKFKCVNRQELVIGGFTEPEGERKGFGAIIVGYYEDGGLVCAGKVGTGFDDDALQSLGRKMSSRERKTSPFDRGEAPSGEIHWISPELVAEIGFTEWTNDGRLRHPRYIGLRRDKSAREVVREKPKAAPA